MFTCLQVTKSPSATRATTTTTTPTPPQEPPLTPRASRRSKAQSLSAHKAAKFTLAPNGASKQAAASHTMRRIKQQLASMRTP